MKVLTACRSPSNQSSEKQFIDKRQIYEKPRVDL